MLLQTSPPLAAGLLIASVAILLAAALHDIVARTVPNWMAAVLALLGFASQALHGSLLTGLLAALIVFVLAAVAWRGGWMGGGDVKLLGAATLVVPPGDAANFIATVALVGAALALLYLVARRIVGAPGPARPVHLFGRALRAERWRIRRGGPLPYACAIAGGFLFITL